MIGLRSRLFVLLALFCLIIATPAHAEKRVALVIGNGAYAFQPTLRNPKNDADDVGKALRALDFKVIVGTDLDRSGMNRVLDEFANAVDGADITFVYYSGHGMQLNGVNWLLPVDAQLDNVATINRFRLLPLQDVLETLRLAHGAKVVVLDACRSNPVENELKRRLASLPGSDRAAVETQGLAKIKVNGLLVAYSTQSDEVASDGGGRNSPFTSAFIKYVGEPNVDIRQMFYQVQDEVDRETASKQRPELSISLIGEYKLKITITPVNPGETAPPGGSAPIIVGPSEAERAWGFVKDTTSQDVLEDFIRRYGDTFYGTLARERVEELKKTAKEQDFKDTSPVADPALFKEVLERLYELNFDPDLSDSGSPTEPTRRAIREFEQLNGLPPTGVITMGLLRRLRAAGSLKPWGAVVYGNDSNKWGMAWDENSRRAALAHARLSCGEAKNCPAEISFFGSQCGAFAYSASGWAIIARDEIGKAKDAALDECNKRGRSCQIVAAVCANGAGRVSAAK
jgi:hypothetical protein